MPIPLGPEPYRARGTKSNAMTSPTRNTVREALRERHALRVALALLALSFTASFPALPQQGARPTLRAHRLQQPPLIDGTVRAEPLWALIEPATGFTQVEPFEGQAASEKTEVRIGFDDTTLYIAVVCYDSEARTLAVSDSRRDADLSEEDSFRVVLDTYLDHQNGFVFGTNVAGIQYDGQVNNEGRGGGGGRGRGRGGGGANLDWDTSWTVRTSVGDHGWSAELAIPFRSLRYASGADTWGINIERNVRRKSETAFWAPLGRQFNLFRVSAAGTLSGIEAPKQRNLQIVPYALGSATDDGINDTDDEFDGGFDLKYGITPSLTLDVTVNTDFAQVEADDQQVNLDRFSLFFPEKRPFFLENAGLFKVGSSGGGFSSSGAVDLFFSRRIGLDGGEQVPILGGVRLSGKAAGLNIGFLNMQTDEQGDLQANNFTVARVSQEYRNRSRAGVIVINRQGTGSLAPDDDYNRTYGVDGQIGLGQYSELSGWAAMTETPGVDGDEHAFGIDSSYSSPAWRWRAGVAEVGAEFNPEVGFLGRSDYRRFNGFFMRRFRPKGQGRIKEIGPRVFYDSYWDFDGFQETMRWSPGGELEFRSGARISLSTGGSLEALKSPFEIFPGIIIPPGRYSNNGSSMFFNTNRGRAVSLGGRIQQSGFFSGDQFSFGPSLNIRLGEYLSSEISWSHNDIDLAEGAFKTNLGRARVTFAFSTQLLLQALFQYNDVTDTVSTNLRFSWLGQANTGLFVVYNEVSEFGALAAAEPNRSIIIKYSRLFDVFR